MQATTWRVLLSQIQTLSCPLIGVFGNNDGDHELLKTVQRDLKPHNPRALRLGNCDGYKLQG
jgi:hypothetical protein